MKKYQGIQKSFRFLGKYKLEIILLCALLIIVGLLAILPAQFIGLSIDVISKQNIDSGLKVFIYNNITNDAYWLILFFVIISLLYLLVDVFYGYRVTKLSRKFARDIQNYIFNVAIKKFSPIHHKISVGDLIARITKEVNSSLQIINIPLSGILRSVIQMVWILIIFLLWNYKLALLTLVLSIPIFFVAKIISDKTKKCNMEANEINATLTQFVMNIFNNIKFIHVNKSYENESKKASNMINDMHNKYDKLNISLSRLFPLVNIIKTIAIASVLLLFYSLVQKETISAGDAIIVFLYLERFFNPILSMRYSLQALSKAEASLKRVFDIENLVSDYTNDIGSIKLNKGPEISFENISCEISENKIINNLTKTIKKQSINIIKGESGKGKSTLINALLDLFNLSKGEININNVSYRDIIHNPDNVSVAFQEHNLFNRSIRDNIAYNTEFDKDKARNLLELFNMKEFIDKHGFDYVINDQAQNISGGERKRLSVIRAIYKDSPIYIFDEPSAELDEDNIKRLINLLLSIKKDATIIISTHDKSLMEIGDHIINV